MLLLKFLIVLTLKISADSLEFKDAFNVNLRIFGGIGQLVGSQLMPLDSFVCFFKNCLESRRYNFETCRFRGLHELFETQNCRGVLEINALACFLAGQHG